MTDTELLCSFVRDHLETAFGELVARYLPLVYSAALRQTNGDAHLAKDVAQLVFTDFARKAPSLSEKVILGGWLHRATIFAARQIMRGERRRQLREHEAVSMNTTQSESDDADWRQIHPLLDEVLDHMSKTDRDALILRFFQQQSFADVGASLGGSEEAARKRVTRALEKLRNILRRRGVTTTAAALSTTISANAIQPAPADLAAAIAHSSFAAAGTGTTFTLLKIMTATQLKLGVSALVAAGVAAAFAIQHQTQTRLLNQNKSFQQQIRQLQNSNENLSSRITDLNDARKLSDQQFEDLMRLRSEVGMLRQRTNEMEKSQALLENSVARQAASQKTNSAADQQKQFALARLNDAHHLIYDFIVYENKYGQYPTNFDQIDTNNYPINEADNFQIVYQGSPDAITNIADTIIIQEAQPWQTLEGKWAKTYAFADGHAEVHVEANGDFSAFEQKHSVSPAANGQ